MNLATVLSCACLAAAAGCAATRAPATAPVAVESQSLEALPLEALEADVVLIGENHDNARQHRLRLGWLESLTRDRRVAIALEQLDADRQEAIDRARVLDEARATRTHPPESLAVRARRLADAGGFEFQGWDWEFYRPVIELALRRDLPLVAANLSRRDTMRVVRGEAPPAAKPSGWHAADTATLRASVRAGHCNLLPEKTVAAMAAAQRTRDAAMAQAIAKARRRTGLPVVLLAGNGHVRRDVGVPRHLADFQPADRVVTIGLLETGDSRPGEFDHSVTTDAQPREDPCAGLRDRFRPSGPGSRTPVSTSVSQPEHVLHVEQTAGAA